MAAKNSNVSGPRYGYNVVVATTQASINATMKMFLDSVEQPGRLIVVDESPPRCGLASDIAALVASKAFAALKAPIELVTAPHTPVPFARELERAYLPTSESVQNAVRKTFEYR